MLNIVCVNADNYLGRGKEYVEILYDMVRRNLSTKVEGRFICFTNDGEPYADGIIKRRLYPGLTGWWNKMYLFKPGLFDEGDRIIYFDLDTCIVGGLDDIINYMGNFGILRDAYRNGGYQSSIMMWKANYPDVWDKFEQHDFLPCPGGDQEFIEFVTKDDGKPLDILQDLYPDCFLSYKKEATKKIPKGAKVVYFHGQPRPHDAQFWVPYIWKIGGGSMYEQEVVCNTSDDKLLENVVYAMGLSYENLADQYCQASDDQLVIVGGGPSLKKYLFEIKLRQEQGQIVWALNNSFNYLVKNGIYPDAQIMLDAREENVEFVPEKTNATLIYASQCHPSVFKKAAEFDNKVIIWHSSMESVFELARQYKKRAAFIGVGTSVGMKALGLGQLFGFKHMHLYGYDSSYSDNQNHAYDQPINDNERIIDVVCGDKTFKCAPWMATQAQEFEDSLLNFFEHGIDFTVHGEGLIPYKAQLIAIEVTPDLEDPRISLKNGAWWPSKDIMCIAAMNNVEEEVKLLLKYVEKFDFCVQAGGNVGMWPKELAKHFKTVLTFEPDYVNFKCLDRNVQEPNVLKVQSALSDKRTTGALHREEINCGAHYMQEGAEFPVMALNSYPLEALDLIQLDIEGFEYKALLGGLELINKFHPVIVCEEKGLGDKYGISRDAIKNLLLGLGYKISDKIARDVVYTYVG
jgi:FkbM family methyltransferase